MGFSRDKSLERVRAAPAVAPPYGQAARQKGRGAPRRKVKQPGYKGVRLAAHRGAPASRFMTAQPPNALQKPAQNRARLPKAPLAPPGQGSVAPHPRSVPRPRRGSVAKTTLAHTLRQIRIPTPQRSLTPAENQNTYPDTAPPPANSATTRTRRAETRFLP